jgi:hypothetical protein
MSTDKARVLLVLPQDVLDRARVLAGKATTALKLSVSLQIVLRALIEAGLKRDRDGTILANIESEAQAVRRIRSAARRRGRTQAERRRAPLEIPRPPIRKEGRRRGP